jgi:hypothetical protein
MLNTLASEIATILLLLAGLAGGLEAGFRLGCRATERMGAAAGTQIGGVQGAILGLLGLLLGFSFSGASGRFMERQDLIIRDASAISSAAERADFLDEPFRSTLRAQLSASVDLRVNAANVSGATQRQMLADLKSLHARMWRNMVQGVAARPSSMFVVVPAVGEVTDMPLRRVGAGHKHLPELVLGILVACSIIGMGVIGYGCGLCRQRNLALTLPLALLICASLWAIMDLDNPRAGLIQLEDDPLREAQPQVEPPVDHTAPTPATLGPHDAFRAPHRAA